MKRIVQVTAAVEVEVDESRFTDEFLDEFAGYMFPLDTVEEHIEHLATLHARNIAHDDGFIEGYGNAEEFGIKFHIDWVEAEFQRGHS